MLAVGVRFWHDSHNEMGSGRTQAIELVLAHGADLNLHQRIEPYRGTRLSITVFDLKRLRPQRPAHRALFLQRANDELTEAGDW